MWTLEGAVTEGRRDPNLFDFSSFIRLSSPTNVIDLQLTSNVSATPDRISVGYGFKYLTSRDRQFKTVALKTENNRRNEVTYEVKLCIN